MWWTMPPSGKSFPRQHRSRSQPWRKAAIKEVPALFELVQNDLLGWSRSLKLAIAGIKNVVIILVEKKNLKLIRPDRSGSELRPELIWHENEQRTGKSQPIFTSSRPTLGRLGEWIGNGITHCFDLQRRVTREDQLVGKRM